MKKYLIYIRLSVNYQTSKFFGLKPAYFNFVNNAQ